MTSLRTHDFDRSRCSTPRRSLRLLAAAIGLVVLATMIAGCDDAEIRRYTVERLPELPKRAASQMPGMQTAAAGPQRLLGAIVPRGERTWFFKMVGAPERIATHKLAFDALVASIRFAAAADEPDWSVPDGWRQTPGNEMRFATLKPDSPGDPTELTITRLPSSGILENVNRWRGQIGLAAISESELGDVATKLELNGVSAHLVDMKNDAGAGRASAEDRGHGQPHLHFTKPDGWTELPGDGAGGMRIHVFEVAVGDAKAEITISAFGGGAGGLAANIDRWRTQVKLGPATAQELVDSIQRIDIAGAPAGYVDLPGPESAGTARERILGVILPQGGQTWFIKMKGPFELVESQKATFEAFVQSIKPD